MLSKEKQKLFISLAKTQFTPQEFDWLYNKMEIISSIETSNKFNIYFSLVSRFISSENTTWSSNKNTVEEIYPGFSKSTWSKQDLARVLLMISLDESINKSILTSLFEMASMKEQIALYKGLYLLQNAADFKAQVTEGIRTNMVNVFDAIALGNPFAKTYLNEDAWNQLILKALFLERKLYPVQGIDQGKNINLANMLQDYIKERWAAGRNISVEIWRLIDGYLREDIKDLISKRQHTGLEGEIIKKVLNQNNAISLDYWDKIGKTN